MSNKGPSRPVFDHDKVMARIAAVAGLGTDVAIAAELGASPQTFANWKRRGFFPYASVCEFALRRNISMDWLLLGLGSPGPIGNPFDAGVLNAAFELLHEELLKVVAADDISWPFLKSSAVGIYSIAASFPDRSQVDAIVRSQARERAADWAGVVAIGLRQNKPKETKEIARLERLATELYTEARALRSSSPLKVPSEPPAQGRRRKAT